MRPYRSIKTKPRRSGPPRASKYTSALVANLARHTKFVDPNLSERWTAIVGREIAELCRPGRLTGGKSGRTLEVFAKNAAAAARVQFETETLKRQLNDYLGPGAVARIAVRHRETGQQHDEKPVKPALSRFFDK